MPDNCIQNEDTGPKNADLAAAISRLEHLQQQLIDEIVSYPAPIPACDVHFNALLEERSQITSALKHARQAALTSSDSHGQSAEISALIQSSNYLRSHLAEPDR